MMHCFRTCRNLFTLLLFLISQSCLSEGSKQISSDSIGIPQLWIHNGQPGGYTCFGTSACDDEQSLFIHIAHPGEKVYFGFKDILQNSVSFKVKLDGNIIFTGTAVFMPGSPGHIPYYSQAVAGPNVLNPHGYNPIVFTPAQAGDYRIEFNLPPNNEIYLRYFDITVIDTTITPFTAISGRLWSKDWSLDCPGLIRSTFYVLSTDSIVTSVGLNNMFPMDFDIACNRNGCFPPPAAWDTSCLSHHWNRHYAEYKLFLNNPDSTEYPTGEMGFILGDTVHVERKCDGTFNFQFKVSKEGKVKLTIESDNTPGIQSEDLIINQDVGANFINTITWNGMNGLGTKVPCGDSIRVSIQYINGLTNLPCYDIEDHTDGFIIHLIRPSGLPVASYWNDSLVEGDIQLTGCYYSPPDSGCHTWIMDPNGSSMGESNTINTWWYAASSNLDLGMFAVTCIPYQPLDISGDDSVCGAEEILYTVNPNPLPGSEKTGYEWILKDYTTGTVLLDSNNCLSSIRIDFSQYPPGMKNLIVRGHSNECGYGPFGPGINGILISVTESPVIINNPVFFTICSGDTTDISLQSTMPGSVFSYSVSSSSPSVTGQAPGSQNPIRQILTNTGTGIDSVFYNVVPSFPPCEGDTVIFTVAVLPDDTLVIPINVSANPSCIGDTVVLSVDTLLTGPGASFFWFLNGNTVGLNVSQYSYIPADGDKIGCTINSPEFCNPGQTASGTEITMSVLQKVPVSVTLQSSPSELCPGDSVMITASPVNGGPFPSFQWNVNGMSAGSDTSVFAYIPGNGDLISCRLTSGLACVQIQDAFDSITLSVNQVLKIVDTTICFGKQYFAGGNYQTLPGTYFDTLIPPVNCVQVVQINLNFYQAIALFLGNDTTLCGDPFILDSYIPGAAYEWQNGSVDSVLEVTEPGIYWVMVNLNGCSSSDTIRVGPCPATLWFPNAFTPNQDGLNDTFHPKGISIEQFSMQIYDRWGTLIFQCDAPEPGWDGMIAGSPAPPGNYVYKASFKDTSGKTITVSGVFVLIR